MSDRLLSGASQSTGSVCQNTNGLFPAYFNSVLADQSLLWHIRKRTLPGVSQHAEMLIWTFVPLSLSFKPNKCGKGQPLRSGGAQRSLFLINTLPAVDWKHFLTRQINLLLPVFCLQSRIQAASIFKSNDSTAVTGCFLGSSSSLQWLKHDTQVDTLICTPLFQAHVEVPDVGM